MESEREETLLAEHARLHALWRRNLAKRYDPRTKPRSRFAYAAHATKLEHKLRQVEGNMRGPIPTYDAEYERDVNDVIRAGYVEQRAAIRR